MQEFISIAVLSAVVVVIAYVPRRSQGSDCRREFRKITTPILARDGSSLHFETPISPCKVKTHQADRLIPKSNAIHAVAPEGLVA